MVKQQTSGALYLLKLLANIRQPTALTAPAICQQLRGEGGVRERGNGTSKSTGRSSRQNAATCHNMRREERVTVQGPVKKQQPGGMPHVGAGGGVANKDRARLPSYPCARGLVLKQLTDDNLAAHLLRAKHKGSMEKLADVGKG